MSTTRIIQCVSAFSTTVEPEPWHVAREIEHAVRSVLDITGTSTHTLLTLRVRIQHEHEHVCAVVADAHTTAPKVHVTDT